MTAATHPAPDASPTASSAAGGSRPLTAPLAQPVPAVMAAMLLFAATTVLGVWLRPLLPVDETRYLTIAWELYGHDNHLRMTLNAEAYGHKPPLLFSLIEEVWDLVGTPSELIGRLVPPLFGLGCLGLVAALALRLWPSRPGVAASAPFVLLSIVAFPIFAQLVMFDAALTFMVLAGILALWIAASGRALAGWTLFALAVGIGALTKGPVVLVHLLPAALAAPLWHPARAGMRRRHWYAGLALALAGGAAIALAWVAMAVREAGDGFGFELVWRQSAGRVVDAFSHRRPWWFFFALAPVFLAPWAFWGPLWHRRTWRALAAEPQTRLLLIWAVGALVLHSAFQSKQIHYVLPLLPAVALIVARRLEPAADGAAPLRWFGVAVALSGIAVALLPLLPRAVVIHGVPGGGFALWFGPAVVVVGLLIERVARRGDAPRPALLAALVAALIVVGEAGSQRALARVDLVPVMRLLPDPATTPLAWLGVDQGEFGFLARRTVPVASFAEIGALRDWAARHPDGYVVVPVKRNAPPVASPPLARLAYGSNEIWIWRAPAF